jgi:hypothetical protein
MKSSPQHVAACLSRLAIVTSKTWKTPLDEKAALTVFADLLVVFTPETVTKACDEWGRINDRWPTLAGLLRLCRECENEVKAARVITDPNQPENFLARVKRLSIHDAPWLSRHHYLLDQAIQDHMHGRLTDAHLAHCITLVEQGLPSTAQPSELLSIETMQTVWAGNDRISEVVRGNIEHYFAGQALLSMYDKMAARRWSEYPELAALYCGGDRSPSAAAISLPKPPIPANDWTPPASPPKILLRRATDEEVRESARRLNKLP